MNQIVCVVYDSKARCYCAPFFVPTIEVAIRAFAGEANNPNSQLGKYPTDFSLFELGSFNDEVGKFGLTETPINHGLAAQYRRLDHVREIASKSVSDEAQFFAGAKGGDSA